MSALQNFTASVAPSATTETLLYAVPSSALNCVVSSMVVCNRSGSPTTFRISASPGGNPTVVADYIYYDVPIQGNDTFIATVGLTPAAQQTFRVYAGSANLSFSIWGSQIS